MTMRERWQLAVALVGLGLVVYLLFPLWVAVAVVTLELIIGVPLLGRRRARHRARR
jgi:hypothetical protein